MTDRAKNNLRKSLWLLLLAVAIGYGATSWVFPEESRAQAFLAKLDTKEFYDSENLQAFYEQRGMKPIWIRGSGTFQPQVHALASRLL